MKPLLSLTICFVLMAGCVTDKEKEDVYIHILPDLMMMAQTDRLNVKAISIPNVQLVKSSLTTTSQELIFKYQDSITFIFNFIHDISQNKTNISRFLYLDKQEYEIINEDSTSMDARTNTSFYHYQEFEFGSLFFELVHNNHLNSADSYKIYAQLIQSISFDEYMPQRTKYKRLDKMVSLYTNKKIYLAGISSGPQRDNYAIIDNTNSSMTHYDYYSILYENQEVLESYIKAEDFISIYKNTNFDQIESQLPHTQFLYIYSQNDWDEVSWCNSVPRKGDFDCIYK